MSYHENAIVMVRKIQPYVNRITLNDFEKAGLFLEKIRKYPILNGYGMSYLKRSLAATKKLEIYLYIFFHWQVKNIGYGMQIKTHNKAMKQSRNKNTLR